MVGVPSLSTDTNVTDVWLGLMLAQVRVQTLACDASYQTRFQAVFLAYMAVLQKEVNLALTAVLIVLTALTKIA